LTARKTRKTKCHTLMFAFPQSMILDANNLQQATLNISIYVTIVSAFTVMRCCTGGQLPLQNQAQCRYITRIPCTHFNSPHYSCQKYLNHDAKRRSCVTTPVPLSHTDLKFLRPPAVASEDSKGLVTDCSTCSGLAPGYDVTTIM